MRKLGGHMILVSPLMLKRIRAEASTPLFRSYSTNRKDNVRHSTQTKTRS